MIVEPGRRRWYEETLLQTARESLDYNVAEMAKRGRTDWTLELEGEYPETEVVARCVERGTPVIRRFPVWDDDWFGWQEERDDPHSAGGILVINVYEPGLWAVDSDRA